MLAPRNLSDPYGKAGGKAKRRQRPWANATKGEVENRESKWAAGTMQKHRNYYGRGVTKPRPVTAGGARLRGSKDQRTRRTRSQSASSSRRRKKKQNDVPQYSVKYVGVANGEMGVLSRRVVMPTTKSRMPKAEPIEHRPKYRLDPNSPVVYPLRKRHGGGTGGGRPQTAPANDMGMDNNGMDFDQHSGFRRSKPSGGMQHHRPGSAPSHVQGNSGRQRVEQAAAAPGREDVAQEKDLPAGAPADEHEQMPQDDVGDTEEEDFPNPEKYDRWLVQAIPPRSALSAGRSRSPAPNILPVDGGYGTRSGSRRTTYRPKSSPAYIISAVKDDVQGSPAQVALEQARYAMMNPPTRLQPGGRVRPATTGGGMGGARSLRLHRQREPFAHAQNRFGITEEESLTEPVPFVVHRRVRGWKLTSPYPGNNQLSRSSFVPTNAPMNAMVRHKRLTAEDIMQEQHAQLAGDPSLLQPMMDPLAQVLEEERRARVKLRQTAAVMETFDRWQRGRATKPWRSGHAWDQPHPELPFEQSGDFPSMSSTPSAYAAMHRAERDSRTLMLQG